MPLVSIIVPNYNHARYLELRLKSIFDQTFQDFEVLIFDDASSDSSTEVIKRYQNNPKITYVEFGKVNSGSPFGAWEQGVHKAKGKFIWIAESDDLAQPTFLETHVRSFEENKKLIVSFSASQWMDKKGVGIHIPEHEQQPYLESCKMCLVNELTKGTFIYNMSSAVILKEALNQVDFNKLKTFQYVGDWYFWSSICKKEGMVQRKPEPLNLFRRHDGNVSFEADKRGLQFLEGFPILTDILKSTSISFFQKQRIFAFWAKKLYFSEIKNKVECLKLLPLWGRLWYSLIPLIAKRPK